MARVSIAPLECRQALVYRAYFAGVLFCVLAGAPLWVVMSKEVMNNQSIRLTGLQRKQLQTLVNESMSLNASEVVRVGLNVLLDNVDAFRRVVRSMGGPPKGMVPEFFESTLVQLLFFVLRTERAKELGSTHAMTSPRRAVWLWVARDGRAVRFGCVPAPIDPSCSCDFGESRLVNAPVETKVDYAFAHRIGRCYSMGGECP